MMQWDNPWGSFSGPAFAQLAQQLYPQLAQYFGQYSQSSSPFSGLGASPSGTSVFGPAPQPTPTTPPPITPAAPPPTSQTTAPPTLPASGVPGSAPPPTSPTTGAPATQGYWAVSPQGGQPVWTQGIPAPGVPYFSGTQSSGPQILIGPTGEGGMGGRGGPGSVGGGGGLQGERTSGPGDFGASTGDRGHPS